MDRTIIIIEDEPAILDSYATLLRIEGYKVEKAKNGLKGWELIQKWNPDLIITDLSIPILNGEELIEKVRKSQRFSEIPILVLSASIGDFDLEKYSRVYWLNKPVPFKVVISRLKEILSSE
tara:strand:- start:3044 stop:3406 length:363 start_codon:yes stop_codon:yes gene_type:complete